jgi:cytosine/creatinine deaminase
MLAGMIRLPLMVDAHVHLDKTFTIERTGRVTGGLHASIERCVADAKLWSAEDIRRRASLALERAWSHGTCAMRTHVDWTTPSEPIAWAVLKDLRDRWRGHIDLQLVSLQFPELFDDLGWAQAMARSVAITGDVIGGFIHAQPELERRMHTLFRVAAEAGCRIDLHCDEGIGDHLAGFDSALNLVERFQMQGRVVCSHVCALSYRDEHQVADLLARAGELEVGIISLPTTNLYLQDRPFHQAADAPVRTARLRGIAPVHEARAAGVAVAIASDNCRDPFYPYGDYNLLAVFEAAALALQFDPASDWLNSLSTIPAKLMGLPDPALAITTDYVELDAADIDDALSRRVPLRVVRSQPHPPSA